MASTRYIQRVLLLEANPDCVLRVDAWNLATFGGQTETVNSAEGIPERHRLDRVAVISKDALPKGPSWDQAKTMSFVKSTLERQGYPKLKLSVTRLDVWPAHFFAALIARGHSARNMLEWNLLDSGVAVKKAALPEDLSLGLARTNSIVESIQG
jgi:hypothetical protein